jgi:membrane protease YdiL (CAAX protease family)
MFTLRFFLTLLVAALAAALISPFIAAVLAWAGFQFPFPRIFDRVVMVSLAVAMWWECRELGVVRRLQAGFSKPRNSLLSAGLGFLIGAAAIAILWTAAWLTAPSTRSAQTGSLALVLATATVSALTIAIIEEGFFRAFLLDGMAQDFGERAALIASSIIYAVSHFVRSPARFHVRGIQPLVGFKNLAASVAHLGHPIAAAPGLLGLFLLGLLLGLAFLKTGRVYLSIGIHAGVIVGAKTWRRFAPGAQSAPGWLSGYGFPPLISGAAAWLIIVVLLLIQERLLSWDRFSNPSFLIGEGRDDTRN